MARRRVRVFAAAVGLCAVTLLLLWCATLLRPAWWRPPDDADPGVRRLADDFEYRLVEEAQRHRPEGNPWAVRIDEDDVNAWLATRLAQWIAHDHELEWPESFGTPQVSLEPGLIRLGLQLETGFRPIVSATVKPSIRDGKLALGLDRISIGRMAMPGSPVDYLLGRLEDETSQQFLREESVQSFIEFCLHDARISPVLDLVDGRRVRILDLEILDGSVVLQCRTLPARAEAYTPGPNQPKPRQK